MSTPALVEHFFRHEYGRLVATLTRRVGVAHLEAIEDAVQVALITALETWTVGGQPANPTAWLFRVAHNKLVGEFRQRSGRQQILARAAAQTEPQTEAPESLLAGELQDDLLRMLFVCCDPGLPTDSQLALALKILCGFSVAEIAQRLFTTEANVYKRITRARHGLRLSASDEPTWGEYAPRLENVQRVLYLLFTEGHLSSHAEAALRRELCDEAVRLATLLAQHRVGGTAETHALLALMHLHRGRMTARQNAAGTVLLLQEQDRATWDADDIATGMAWLARSAQGEQFSRYHAEAGVAAEHCRAPSFEATRWDRVVSCYEILEDVAPSPLHSLNRAVAVAEWKGPEAALEVIRNLQPPTWLEGSYLWSAVLADLHRRAGSRTVADRYRRSALESAPTEAVRATLRRRLMD